MKKLFLLFSIANTILLLFPMALMAQQTHVLEPSIMEVAYHEISGKYNDDYALRVGKSMSQYFSYHKLRDDSLSSNAQTSMIILQEMLDEANNRNDASKQRASGPDHGDYFYRSQANNTFDTYTSFMGQGYKITEPIPVQDWNIVTDSTRQILGYNCYMATTTFRGRQWTVYYTEDIPMPLGPWKLGGLPGLILFAEVKGFITIEASGIKTKSTSPVTFYNFLNKKYEAIQRDVYIKERSNPKAYPKNTIVIPQMELQ